MIQREVTIDMAQGQLRKAVMEALSQVTHGTEGPDVVSSGTVRELDVDESGTVRFAFTLRPDDPGALVKEVRAAAEAVPGVTEVKVNVQLPKMGQGSDTPPQAPSGGGPAGAAAPDGAVAGAGPGQGGSAGGLQPGSVPAPTPMPGLLSQVDHVVAVSSGKGGVGKSMVASNLAAALGAAGLRTGLLDADVYGPNVPRMFGESRRPRVAGEKGQEMIEPLEAHGVRLMSLGFLLEDEQPAIMRGPLISGILKQFLEQVEWGGLDILLVDMPPGTGDAQLSLVQTIDLDGAVMVTTPQQMSVGDVRRGIKMFERVNTRVLGLIENMGPFECPGCGSRMDIFGSGGGEALAREMGLDLFGTIPLDPAIRESGDRGVPTVLGAPESPAARALSEAARRVMESLREVQRTGAQ